MQDATSEYIHRDPETTLMYQVVAEQLETFLSRQQERDHPVPRFVERKFRSLWTAEFWPRLFAASLRILWTRPASAVLV